MLTARPLKNRPDTICNSLNSHHKKLKLAIEINADKSFWEQRQQELTM